MNLGNKRGQVTLFILVAILIVAVILLFIFYIRPTYISDVSGGLEFERCVKEVVEDGIEELSNNAGNIKAEFAYKYEDIDYAYLCYTNEYYATCTVQQPFLKQLMEENLEKYTREDITKCYEDSLEELRAQGYGVQSGEISYDYSLEPGIVTIEIEAPTTVADQQFKTFNYKLNYPIYEIVMIATSILQSESYYGDSDISEMMYYYPDYIIDKLKQSDGTTLYIIQNKNFNTKYRFASRSLAWPAGYI